MTQIVVCDVETTGMGDDAEVCEVGCVSIIPKPTPVSVPFTSLLKPRHQIPPEAMAIHHITNAMVEAATPAESFLDRWNNEFGHWILCAHNAEFEKRWLGLPDTKWICTLKGARKVWPDAPSHGNQVLRYWLGLDADPKLAMPPHRAGPDAYVTALILQRLLKKATVEDLIQWSTEPSLLTKLHFGKHAGEPISEVPSGYLRWMLTQETMDADALHTARTELRRRE